MSSNQVSGGSLATPRPDTDTSDQTHAAEHIGVDEFRQILIWPLALSKADGAEAFCAADRIKAEARWLDSNATPWRRLADPLFHISREVGEPRLVGQRQEPYAEFVYFHDFVQRFLYPAGDLHATGEAGFHLFERPDVKVVKVDWGERSFTLVVDRCNLYLFRTGVAILVLEVASATSDDATKSLATFNLSDVMHFQDLFRRVYTPYFWHDATGYHPGQTPRSVTWLGTDSTPLSPEMTPQSLKHELQRLAEQREPPVYDAWRWLLGLRVRGYDGEDGERACWRHVVDDRIPFTSYVRLKGGLEQVSRGDWVRLCFADSPEKDRPYPYDANFLSHFEADNCYDRFFDRGTRFMFCSYAMVAVGNEGWFFREVIRHHFRHMYFQMALIAHMEYATYLAFSSRISQAVEDAASHGGTRGRWFRDRILKIHDDFLEFVHIFRFTGVSNQLQGKEMFDLWRQHLGLTALFRDLQDELKSATDYLLAKESREQTEAAARLNVIAVAGVILGLVFAFLGMNVIVGQDAPRGFWPGLRTLGLVLSAISALALGIAAGTRMLRRVDDNPEYPIRTMLFGALGLGVMLTVAGSVISWML